MQYKKIQTKFLCCIIPLFIISFIIMSGISYYLAAKYLTYSVNETATAIGEKVATQVQLEMHGKMQRIDDVANMPQIKAGTQEEKVAASSEEVTASVEQSSLASDQIATSVAEVAQSAATLLNLVVSTTALVGQISKRIEQVADNAATVATAAAKTSVVANAGEAAIHQAVNQMSIIEEKTIYTAKVIGELEDRSKQIGQILETISDIAGQTNLLALNAAIEAARAGKQGRGFAVVAEEVRKLAEQSQESAKEIAGLITDVQERTVNAVHFMNEGCKEVNTGAGFVSAVGSDFQDILRRILDISRQIGEISEAIKEVTHGSHSIVNSINEIDRESKQVAEKTQTIASSTQEQSASIEDISSSSNALARLADTLKTATSKFKMG